MTSLLVLGSKPEPVLPPAGTYDALACANASGRSAARHGLPAPSFTVISAILTSGKQTPNRLALEALVGLRTHILYFYPRPARGRGLLRRAWHELRSFRTSSFWFRRSLRSLPYAFERFEDPGLPSYHAMLAGLCRDDPDLIARLRTKQPSSGMLALAIGLAWHGFGRCILSGFSFEITHAYADNPLIRERGSAASRHADTDVALLRHLCKQRQNIYTTEPVVAERAGVPLLTASHRSSHRAAPAG